MADEDKNVQGKTPEKPKEPPKVINVTQPRTSTSIDPNKVSSYTLKEAQALDKLKKQIGGGNQKESKAGTIKSIVAIILVIILILIALLFIIIIGRNVQTEEEDYSVRISMEIENKSSLSIITETGQKRLREINPGDTVPLSAFVRNSDNYRGDSSQNGTPPNIFVRFKIIFILDYEERTEIILPTMSDRWYRYNEEDEKKHMNAVTVDDNFYYYKGSLAFMQRAELFSEITFNGDKIFFEDGGKYGQIQVIVESVEADINSIDTRDKWTTAPREWISKMMQGEYR